MKKRKTMADLIITPKTKIFELLEAYPQLENVLTDVAPQFKKLKNPVLRKTITKVTNLNQAATIGGLNVEELINRLRKEVGQSTMPGESGEQTTYTTAIQPDWFSHEKIKETIDIRDMLHAGEQPVHDVLSALTKLSNTEILKVIAPFIPAPLIDKAASLNYSCWIQKKTDDMFFVFFTTTDGDIKPKNKA